MGFRNDADALLARAEALERENKELRKKIGEREDLENVEAENEQLHSELEELRGKLEDQKAQDDELKAKAKAKAKAAKRTARKLKRDNRKLKGTLGETSNWIPAAIAAVVMAAGVFGGVMKCLNDNKVRTSLGKSRLVHVRVVATTDNRPVASVLFKQTRHTRRGRSSSSDTLVRLTVFNLANGARGETITLFDPPKRRRGSDYKLYEPAGHLAWAKHPVDGLQLVDIRAPAIVLTTRQVAEKLRDLGKYRVQHAAGGVASVVLADGRIHKIDMKQVIGEPPAVAPTNVPSYRCRGRYGLRASCERDQCIGFAKIPGSSAWQLAHRDPKKYNRPNAVNAEASPLLSPALIGHVDRPCAFEHNGDVLVTRKNTAVGPSSRQVSLVSREGLIKWTAAINADQYQILGATQHAGEFFIFLTGIKKAGAYVHLSANGEMIARRHLLPDKK